MPYREQDKKNPQVAQSAPVDCFVGKSFKDVDAYACLSDVAVKSFWL